MSSPKRQLVLVVDDDHELNSLLTFSLERAGFETHSLYAGDETIEWLQDNVPDAVVLDIMLPRVDGIKVLKAIRADKRTKQTPVVIFSVLTTYLNRQDRLLLEADSYLAKPVDVLEVVTEIKRALKK